MVDVVLPLQAGSLFIQSRCVRRGSTRGHINHAVVPPNSCCITIFLAKDRTEQIRSFAVPPSGKRTRPSITRVAAGRDARVTIQIRGSSNATPSGGGKPPGASLKDISSSSASAARDVLGRCYEEKHMRLGSQVQTKWKLGRAVCVYRWLVAVQFGDAAGNRRGEGSFPFPACSNELLFLLFKLFSGEQASCLRNRILGNGLFTLAGLCFVLVGRTKPPPGTGAYRSTPRAPFILVVCGCCPRGQPEPPALSRR